MYFTVAPLPVLRLAVETVMKRCHEVSGQSLEALVAACFTQTLFHSILPEKSGTALACKNPTE